MVCKEDVLLWFKDLEGYKRIDVMYELLNMCVPFEIRFLGSCIEEIGKHSYQELRGSAITANDFDKLSKDASLAQGLGDEGVRHRVLIYLSLLSSRNCKCASWFYKTLLRTEWVESCVLKGNCKDENLQNELLLLFTLGLHHPAFTFDQKTFFGNMLAHVLEQRECKKHIANKPFPGYPPGFGYSHVQKIPTHPDIPVIPVKSASLVHGEPVPLQQHPPNFLAHPIPAPLELIPMWSRPSFAGRISGAPEMAPFPPPPASPLVSQPTSPTPSRAASPHRAFPLRPPGLQPPNQMVDVLPACTPSVPLDPLSQPSLPLFNSDLKTNDDDVNHIPDDKLRDAPWLNSVMLRMDMKPPNGMRFTYSKVPQQYFFDQMQALNLEGENSLHYSSSSSSSNNSLNQSPPDTPTSVPAVPPHGPGRGDSKRMNGAPLGPPCEAPLTSVPYSYPPPVLPTSPSQGPRNPNCYNCGAAGHIGADCASQTIEEITQKKAYTLEYSSPLPEADK